MFIHERDNWLVFRCDASQLTTVLEQAFVSSICLKNKTIIMDFLLSLCFVLIAPLESFAQKYSITGHVNDYQGHPVDSCSIIVYNPDFTEAIEVFSDSTGYYRIDSIPQGRYAAIAAMRVNEYPRMQQVPMNDMKLEFWAWNVMFDCDLKLDIRYGKLELYGTTAFFEYGGRQELLVYTRPMSLTKVIRDPNFMDKAAQEKNTNVTVSPEWIDFKVFVDGSPVNILSVQHLSLPNTNGNKINDDCYLIQTSLPSDIYSHSDKPYEIRVVGHNKEYDEWGENVYYLEAPHFQTITRQ